MQEDQEGENKQEKVKNARMTPVLYLHVYRYISDDTTCDLKMHDRKDIKVLVGIKT